MPLRLSNKGRPATLRGVFSEGGPAKSQFQGSSLSRIGCWLGGLFNQMKDNDFRIRTVWVVFDFQTNARELFRVPQGCNIVPHGILPEVRVAGASEYKCLEAFTADAPISVKLDVANDVGRSRSTKPRPTILSSCTD
jgi:hypothetical protein